MSDTLKQAQAAGRVVICRPAVIEFIDAPKQPPPAHDAEMARLTRRGIEIGMNRPRAVLEVDESLFDDVSAQDGAGQLLFFEVMK